MVHVRFANTLPGATNTSLALLGVNFFLVFAIIVSMQYAKYQHGEGAKQRKEEALKVARRSMARVREK